MQHEIWSEIPLEDFLIRLNPSVLADQELPTDQAAAQLIPGVHTNLELIPSRIYPGRINLRQNRIEVVCRRINFVEGTNLVELVTQLGAGPGKEHLSPVGLGNGDPCKEPGIFQGFSGVLDDNSVGCQDPVIAGRRWGSAIIMSEQENDILARVQSAGPNCRWFGGITYQ